MFFCSLEKHSVIVIKVIYFIVNNNCFPHIGYFHRNLVIKIKYEKLLLHINSKKIGRVDISRLLRSRIYGGLKKKNSVVK
jgi:hypothetical protein